MHSETQTNFSLSKIGCREWGWRQSCSTEAGRSSSSLAHEVWGSDQTYRWNRWQLNYGDSSAADQIFGTRFNRRGKNARGLEERDRRPTRQRLSYNGLTDLLIDLVVAGVPDEVDGGEEWEGLAAARSASTWSSTALARRLRSDLGIWRRRFHRTGSRRRERPLPLLPSHLTAVGIEWPALLASGEGEPPWLHAE